MDSNDLFSFLDEAPPKAESPQPDGDVPMQQEAENPNGSVPKKRKASIPTPQETTSENGPSASSSSEAGPSEPKKPRLASPNPMVVDEVEIEAKREVAASAGLTGAVEAGSRLELRHQVSICACKTDSCASTQVCSVGAASSRGATRLPVHTDIPTCSSRETSARIQVHFGPLTASVCACHPAE